MFYSVLQVLLFIGGNCVSGAASVNRSNISFELDNSANSSAQLLLARYPGPGNTTVRGTVCSATPLTNTTASALCHALGFQRGVSALRSTLNLDPGYAAQNFSAVLGNVSCAKNHWKVCSYATQNLTQCNPTHDVFLRCGCNARHTLANGTCKLVSCHVGHHFNGTQCLKCHANHYNDGSTLDKCLKCPKLERSGPGASQCEPCPFGTFWKKNHTCATCPTGSFGNGATCKPCGERFESAGSDGLCHSSSSSPTLHLIQVSMIAAGAVLFVALTGVLLGVSLHWVRKKRRVNYKNLDDKAVLVEEQPSTSSAYNNVSAEFTDL